ncbi:MAG: ABC transporter ATP-binding protein [Betaproteobacteria bacterium]|nr:ABC transporter ATP-binding protein [Betaproteobacteria bacterium]
MTSTPTRAGDATLEVRNLGKRYGEQWVLRGVNLQVQRGEVVAVVGESGVGKSTLLNCLAGIEHWDEGEVWVDAQALSSLDDTARALLRRRAVGFVFQAFHVLPHLTLAQNIELPLRLLGQRDPARVNAMLEAVGLAGLGERLPQTLSGGQLQRVAIARALVHAPRLLLADEPTGNLDPGTAARILDLLLRQVRDSGGSLVLVTHSVAAAKAADRVIRLESSTRADVNQI